MGKRQKERRIYGEIDVEKEKKRAERKRYSKIGTQKERTIISEIDEKEKHGRQAQLRKESWRNFFTL